MPSSNTSSKLVSGRIILDVLNSRPLRRLMNISGVEEIIEFNITNDSVVTKILDRTKVAKLKNSKHPFDNKKPLFSFSKFDLGRMNTIKVRPVINVINGNGDLKARIGLSPKFEISDLLMRGNYVNVVSIDIEARKAREEQQEKQAQDRANASKQGAPKGNR